KESVKKGLIRKQFPEDSIEYDLNKALNVLYTMMRISKRKDNPTRFQASRRHTAQGGYTYSVSRG
ncbi:MAG: hypothetical protein VXB01_18285, partial [Opitutae bacterium]